MPDWNGQLSPLERFKLEEEKHSEWNGLRQLLGDSVVEKLKSAEESLGGGLKDPLARTVVWGPRGGLANVLGQLNQKLDPAQDMSRANWETRAQETRRKANPGNINNYLRMLGPQPDDLPEDVRQREASMQDAINHAGMFVAGLRTPGGPQVSTKAAYRAPAVQSRTEALPRMPWETPGSQLKNAEAHEVGRDALLEKGAVELSPSEVAERGRIPWEEMHKRESQSTWPPPADGNTVAERIRSTRVSNNPDWEAPLEPSSEFWHQDPRQGLPLPPDGLDGLTPKDLAELKRAQEFQVNEAVRNEKAWWSDLRRQVGLE